MGRPKKHSGPIGIFDSGVGGLSVLSEVKRQLPAEDLIYVADQAHVPYGDRSRDEVLGFSLAIIRFLVKMQAKLVIVACNTASAVALTELRNRFPKLPCVGMEPAVKPAAEETRSGVVGVLATPATFQGDLYASTVEKHARGVKILQDTCPGLVGQIEAGRISSSETRQILERALAPMIDQGVDEIVMGCTHYPFVIPLIREIAGEGIEVIDPAPAVARQAGRLLEKYDLLDRSGGETKSDFFTTGDPAAFSGLLGSLLGLKAVPQRLLWVEGELQEVPRA
ncbi:MAG: glutamate racemase [Anaerolineales bacterium]